MQMYKVATILEPSSSRTPEEIMDEVMKIHRMEMEIFENGVSVYTHFTETVIRKTGEVRRYKILYYSGSGSMGDVCEEDFEKTIAILQKRCDEEPDNDYRKIDLESFRTSKVISEEVVEKLTKLVVYFQ